MSDEKSEDEYEVPLPGPSYSYVSCDCGALMTKEHAERYGRCYTCWERETFTIEQRIQYHL